MKIKTDQELVEYYDENIETAPNFKVLFSNVLQQLRKLEKQLETVEVPDGEFIQEYLELKRFSLYSGGLIAPMSKHVVENILEQIKECLDYAEQGLPWFERSDFKKDILKHKEEWDFFNYAIELEAWLKASLKKSVRDISKVVEDDKEFINLILMRKEQYKQLITQRSDRVQLAMAKYEKEN